MSFNNIIYGHAFDQSVVLYWPVSGLCMDTCTSEHMLTQILRLCFTERPRVTYMMIQATPIVNHICICVCVCGCVRARIAHTSITNS